MKYLSKHIITFNEHHGKVGSGWWNTWGTMMACLCLPVDVLIFYKVHKLQLSESELESERRFNLTGGH